MTREDAAWWAEVFGYAAILPSYLFYFHLLAAIYKIVSYPGIPKRTRAAQVYALFWINTIIPQRARWHRRWMLIWFGIMAVLMLPGTILTFYYLVTRPS